MPQSVRPVTPRLLVLAPLPAIGRKNGDWLLPAKFVNGLKAYAERWPGAVVAGLQPGPEASADLDNAWWNPSDLPFDLQPLSYRALAKDGDPVLDNAVVLSIPHHELHGLARQCRDRGSVYVANTELTLRTQLQIARASSAFGFRLAKTATWLLLEHRRVLREIRVAHGLQCNGTPTYGAYAQRNRNSLLYFDSRASLDMLVSPEDIEARMRRFEDRRCLRILFSGRLSPIKGVHHLLPMANALRQRDMAFELLIAGDGPLRNRIDAEVRKLGLAAQVRCLGTLDFERELMPLLRREVDVFACPHLQGDPSCTYLETMAAGVPIVGYGNEAWLGLQRRSGAGLVSPKKTPVSLANTITALSAAPGELGRLSRKSRDFAADHLFERSFDRRIQHLQTLAQQVTSTAC